MHLANDWKKTARGQALEVLEEVFQEGGLLKYCSQCTSEQVAADR